MRKLLLILLLLPVSLYAQFMERYSTSIGAMQMVVNQSWDRPAVLTLASDDEICFSFDEMSHSYRRFVCRITHCNADWTKSELFPIDYMSGFNEFNIEEWNNSENTTTQYTHYEFSIPNEQLSLKVSGNYKVEIFDDDADDEEPVAVFGFAVLERKVALRATVSSNTEIDINKEHQQVSIVVDYSGYRISNPSADIDLVVTQNRRRDNMVTGLKPVYITGTTLEYVHEKGLVFEAGNEYRRFEITDPHSPGMNVERVSYDGEVYHTDLYPDRANRSHLSYYDEDGRYFVNTLEGYGSALEADYTLVHFVLDMPYRSGGNFYLLGDWWGNGFRDSNILVYDNMAGAYVSSQFLKFGVYNYQYVWVPDEQSRAYTKPAEGDFYNTENEYLILLYHREFGARYDKLIGMQQIIYK